MHEEQDGALWGWIARLGAGEPAEPQARELARLVLSASGAERVFLVLATDEGEIQRAWGVDLDGLALGDVEQRIGEGWLEAALRQPTPLYQRERPSAGGLGCRLALAGGGPELRPAVLLEHRFQAGRFDGLSPGLLGRWCSLLGLLGRLVEAPSPREEARAREESTPEAVRPAPVAGLTTVQPLAAPRRSFPGLVGESEPWRQALARLDLAVDSELPALIVGETGVGKELFARALHERGPRASSPFVAVNCAALPDSLFEAELFGHAKGAFTGAERARPGLFAAADGGTLFLDEVGELSLPRQASLLRVLQERVYRPVGGDQERPLRVRLVAATNRALEQAVELGTFRRDLLFRLDVLRIRVPSLRERPGDIPLLVAHFLGRAGSKATLTPAALAALAAHRWPGNVRELEHLIQRLTALGIPRVDRPHLPRELRAAVAPRPRGEEDERAEVERALAAHGGNISHAARALGLTRQGLKKRMLRLGLREPPERKTTP
jgi:transcriptional regulator with AAA-type ATPase domain